jgi:hypothetical protein
MTQMAPDFDKCDGLLAKIPLQPVADDLQLGGGV